MCVPLEGSIEVLCDEDWGETEKVPIVDDLLFVLVTNIFTTVTFQYLTSRTNILRVFRCFRGNVTVLKVEDGKIKVHYSGDSTEDRVVSLVGFHLL